MNWKYYFISKKQILYGFYCFLQFYKIELSGFHLNNFFDFY